MYTRDQSNYHTSLLIAIDTSVSNIWVHILQLWGEIVITTKSIWGGGGGSWRAIPPTLISGKQRPGYSYTIRNLETLKQGSIILLESYLVETCDGAHYNMGIYWQANLSTSYHMEVEDKQSLKRKKYISLSAGDYNALRDILTNL